MKAWAVLTRQDELRPYGNGTQSQYPIFPTRKEAVSWRDENLYDRGRIVAVAVAVKNPPRDPLPGPKKKSHA